MRRRSWSLAALLLAGGGAALAATGERGGAAWHDADRSGPGGWAAACEGHTHDLTGWLPLAAATLDIAPAQMPAWRTFADAVAAAGADWAQLCAGGMDSGDAVARLRSLEMRVAAVHGMLQDLRPSFEALYAVLDEAQRAQLDAWFASAGRERRRGAWHGGQD